MDDDNDDFVRDQDGFLIAPRYEGDFGPELVVEGLWSDRYEEAIIEGRFSSIVLNPIHGFHGPTKFLERIESLVGLRVEGVGIDLARLACSSTLELFAYDSAYQARIESVEPAPLLRHIFVPWTDPWVKWSRSPALRLAYLSDVTDSYLNDYPLEAPLAELLLVNSRRLGDISGLGKWDLSNLRVAELYSLPRVSDVSVLGHATELRRLSLEGVKVGTLDWLRDLKSLERLILHRCGSIPTLDPVRAIATLQFLGVDGSTTIEDGRVSDLIARFEGSRNYIVKKRGYT